MQRMFLFLNKTYANSRGLFIVALFGLVVLSCSSFNSGMADNNNSLAVNTLVIEPAAEIPVLDGKATTTGIYVHNYSDFTIQNIRYDSLAINGTQRVVFPSDNLCNEVAAHSSCLLRVTAPALNANDRGSSLITAYFNEQKTKQLVNYSYVDSQSRHGISFSGDVNISATNYNEGQRVTAYVFAGNHQSFQHVGFYAENNSVSVVSDLELGRRINIATNTVMPLEIWVGNNVIKNNVKIIPYVEEEINYSSIKSPYEMERVMSGYLARKQLNAEDLLNVVISPTIRANLLMSNLPTLKGGSSTESSMTLTVYNNGNLAASAMSLAAGDSSAITIAPASTNPCGTTLAIGASCNYQVSLNNSYSNGSQSLSLTYSSNSQQFTSYLNISYYSSLSEPMLTVGNLGASNIVIPQTNGSVQNANVTIQNTSNAPLVNPQYSVIKSSGLATTTFVVSNYNGCSTTLFAPGSSCTLQITGTSGSQAESGIAYLQVRGDGNYSFVGMRSTITVLNPSPYITSLTPADGSTNVNSATQLTLNFSQAMNATTLNTNNIQLQKISTSQIVPLTFLGVSTDNQTVNFSITNGPLTDFSSYQIIINPSAIKSSSNAAMSSSSSQVVSTFTTGDYTAPQIISYQPYTGATLQSLLSTVRLSFSESMLVANLNSANITVLRKRDGQQVSIPTTQWVGSELSVYMQHVQFESSESYQLVVNESQIQDSSINHNPMGTIANYVVSQFTTGNFLLPTVSSVSPLNGAIGVSASAATIQITFSQPMDKTTITNSTVTLKRVYDGANIPLSNESFNYLNNVVSFNPSSALQPNVEYQIILPTPSAIKDASGNAMDSGTPILQGTFTATTNANSMILYNSTVVGTVAIGESYGESLLNSSNNNSGSYDSITANNSGKLLTLGPSLLSASVDNGTTWNKVAVPAALASSGMTTIYCSHYNALCLVSGATTNSIARSTDGGSTWSTESIPSSLGFQPNQIVCDTSAVISSTNCFMSMSGQTTKSILRSTDGGATWSTLVVRTGSNTILFRNIDIYTNPTSGASTLFVAGYNSTTAAGFISALTNLSSSSFSTTTPSGQVSANSNYQFMGCDYNSCVTIDSSGYWTAFDGTSWVYKAQISGAPSAANYGACFKVTVGCITIGSDMVIFQGAGVAPQKITKPTTNFTNLFMNWDTKVYWGGNYGNLAKSSGFSNSVTALTGGPFTAVANVYAFVCQGSSCARSFRNLNTDTLGYLQYSSDGGITWTNSNYSFSSATSGSNIVDIKALGSNIFVASSGIEIVRSTDGGKTWTTLQTYTNVANTMLSCYQTKCLVVPYGSSSTGYYSSNSGSTWSSTAATGVSNGRSLFCWGTTCLIAGNNTMLRKSTNFGTSWTTITMPTGFNTLLSPNNATQISCVGAVCLIAGNDTVTGNGAIWRSSDYGSTWSSISSSAINVSGVSWASVQCSDSYCLALNTNGTLPIYSTDLGLSWQSWSRTYSIYSKILLNLN